MRAMVLGSHQSSVISHQSPVSRHLRIRLMKRVGVFQTHARMARGEGKTHVAGKRKKVVKGERRTATTAKQRTNNTMG